MFIPLNKSCRDRRPRLSAHPSLLQWENCERFAPRGKFAKANIAVATEGWRMRRSSYGLSYYIMIYSSTAIAVPLPCKGRL